MLQRAPSELSSDYDKATLFTAIAKLPAVTDAHRILIARAAKTITSDYDQRRTLAAVMDARPLSAPLAAAVMMQLARLAPTTIARRSLTMSSNAAA